MSALNEAWQLILTIPLIHTVLLLTLSSFLMLMSFEVEHLFARSIAVAVTFTSWLLVILYLIKAVFLI